MSERLASLRAEVNRHLDLLVRGDDDAPAAIVEAVRYAVLGDGKRFRPLLLLSSGEALGGSRSDLMPAACAVEMIHCFSLVHDDLPALDDDHLRRGRPTVHVRFGEAVAVLAGDALLNMAFEVLSRHPERPGFETRKLEAIRVLGTAVGLSGMIGGQVLDLEYERKRAEAPVLERIHRMKTGALITASCVAGGILAGGDSRPLGVLERYGRALGLAFQITDDILDVEGTAQEIGKSPGKDAKAEKTTFPAVWGLERSRQMAAKKVEEAAAEASALGEAAGPLVELARLVANRRR